MHYLVLTHHNFGLCWCLSILHCHSLNHKVPVKPCQLAEVSSQPTAHFLQLGQIFLVDMKRVYQVSWWPTQWSLASWLRLTPSLVALCISHTMNATIDFGIKCRHVLRSSLDLLLKLSPDAMAVPLRVSDFFSSLSPLRCRRATSFGWFLSILRKPSSQVLGSFLAHKHRLSIFLN